MKKSIKEKTKIYCFITTQYNNGDVVVAAFSEKGEHLASHYSSGISWAKHDIGITSEWKHEIYRSYFPRGYELMWIDEPSEEILEKIRNFKFKRSWKYRYNRKGISVDEFWILRGWKQRPKFNENIRPSARGKMNFPLPQNDEELAYVSKKIFGHSLSLQNFSNGYYKCAQEYNSYSDPIFDKHISSSYDVDKSFWETLFDYLGTGGVAVYSYQGFTLKSNESKKRINHWLNNREELMRESYKKQVDEHFKNLNYEI